MYSPNSGSPNERPKVLFVDHVPEVFGGAEINLIELLDWDSCRRAWDVGVACAPGSRLRTALESKGIRCFDYQLPSSLSGFRAVGRRFRLLDAMKGWRAIHQGKADFAEILQRFAPSAVISITNKDHLVAGPVCRTNSVRSIWWVNDLITREFFSWPVRRAFFHGAKLYSDRIATVSECCRAAMIQGGLDPSRVEVVPNGLDLRRYPFGQASQDQKHRPTGEDSTWIVGLIGRITPWKGQHVFLEVAERWKRLGRAGEFWMVGDASREDSQFADSLRNRLESAGLKGTVRMMPFQEDVRHMLSRLNVLMHCSTRPEPFGRVVLEAMAMGIPVVASNQGGIPELIENGRTGFLAEVGQPDTYVTALWELQSQRHISAEIGRSARSLVEERFGMDRVFHSFHRLIQGSC